ncbi:hypothetical protein FQA39_LY01407 [Lamprigera yunnana]|nr:hypothetical protein FQA39_LY01407 [Lamprigera yunnana]
MWISQKLVGKIIGRCGEKILEISAKSGAKVHFDSHRSASSRKLMFKGTDEQINVAKKLVNEIIKKCQVSRSQMEFSLAKREPRAQAKSPVPLLEVESPKVERISPVPRQSDTQFEVYVSAMIDPSHFWLQMVGPKATQLDQLVEDMTEYYGKEENQNLHTLNSLGNGDLVAAQFNFDKKWYRAEVLKVTNENGMDPLAELYFVDYGDTDLVPCKNVFELRTDFLRLNFQAIECYLAGIEPKGGTWSTEALDKFEEWAHVAQWKKLSAKIDGYCVREKIRAKREGSSVPGIHLYDVNNERDIDIAEELVAHEYAVFKIETNTVASANDIVSS